MNSIKQNHTAEPVASANLPGVVPEFGRTPDVTRLYGLRRGTLYNLAAAGKVRGVTLRVRGHKSGVRLWDLASIRDFIRREMGLQADAPATAEKHDRR